MTQSLSNERNLAVGTPAPRVLVIGLDGGTLDLIGPWAEAGHLPNLKRIMAQGAWGLLRSTVPILSPPAWTSMTTGLNPGRHGIFDFSMRRADSYEISTIGTTQARNTALWDMLSVLGKRVVVINVPFSYPPKPVNGVMITGLGAPEKRTFTFPPELSESLRTEGYHVDLETPFCPGNQDPYLEEIYTSTAKRREIALRLMHRQAWDFFMVVFRHTDAIASYFWHHLDPTHPDHDPSLATQYGDAILEYYRCVDEAIGQLQTAAGPETVVLIVSDHGMGPLYKDVYLNEWLRCEGFLTLRKQALQTDNWMRRLGLTRSNIGRLLSALHLRGLGERVKERLGGLLQAIPGERLPHLDEMIDWQATQAYSFGYNGQIYLNVRGREPQGTVEPGTEYQAVLDRLIQRLLAWVDPQDGKPVVTAVYKKQELYHGPYLEQAPDLLILMRDGAYVTHGGYEFSPDGRLFTAPQTFQSGSHRLNGIVMAYGPGIRPAKGLSANIVDITPTVLYLLGVPVPQTLDGRVIEPLVDPDYLAARPITYGEMPVRASGGHPCEWTEEDEAVVTQKLKELGYLG